MSNPLQVVVIGNGMVGHHFVTQLLHEAPDAHITVIGGEPRPAYDRVHLSGYFDGLSAADLALVSRDEYKAQGIDAIFGDPVAHIVTAKQTHQPHVVTEAGRTFNFDKLVIATGSYPFVPPIPGADNAHCFEYRTIDDLGAIKNAAQGATAGAVVGGGLLGLEAANALRCLGLEAHVVEFAPGLMNVQLDQGGSAMLRREIESLGVHVHTERNTKRIVQGDQTRLSMEFADETELSVDLVIFSAGIRPHDAIAAAAGLNIGPRGGIEVDNFCRTSDGDIYAIGECALWGGRIFGLVAPGYRMAETVAHHLAGTTSMFTGADMSTKLKLLGVDVGSIGDTQSASEGATAYTFADENNNVYKRVITDSSGKHLLGAVLVGDCSDYDILHQMHVNDIELNMDPNSLVVPQVDGAAPTLGAGMLPDSATICSCHNVTKGAIVQCIDAGAQSLGEVKQQTAASSGCGGCAALLKNVVDAELAERGIEVNNNLCEHFALTRQELFDIVRVKQIKTFNELLAQHGQGLGCDVCKPAVASMFASLWNEHILADQHRGLQDTNDLYLGNLQKNGTYSVVPRVAGGEITPAKLIALGEIAQEFDLYTKITGGQRIDLFGAEMHELPQIWRKLVDAGFETGHAYGKAMRTVKSCVGDSWCRYGVQDSVGMAILIENRYKGLRSPHKIKLAVSGCTRECAEAQSKDVGIIATEKGWNLYVCGNGGMRPRHADLFAVDLDDATLIRYIDRFMMFYVRTADRLQRTSVWLENMEGGLPYLQSVIIDDALSIGADLELQMAHLIDSYACEWKATIEDPQKLKKFVHFVNDDEADTGVRFVRERGQKKPAPSKIKLKEVS